MIVAFAVVGGALTESDFYARLLGLASSSYFVVLPVFLLVFLPIHGLLLKRRSVGFFGYVAIGAAGGAFAPVFFGFFLDPHIQSKLFEAFALTASMTISVLTVAIFWVTALWRSSCDQDSIAG